jgi:hypothetical protein
MWSAPPAAKAPSSTPKPGKRAQRLTPPVQRAGRAAAPIWLTAKTSEYRGPVPAWRIDFTGPDTAALYIDAATGEIKAVRTPLWRLYDALWGLHIMDWRDRENFNSILLIFASSLASLLALVGLGLTFYRLTRGLPRRSTPEAQ